MPSVKCQVFHDLEVLVQPSSSNLGGSAFEQQPVVSAVRADGELATSVDNVTVDVYLHSWSTSQSDFPKLTDEPTALSATFWDGVANFSGLAIDDAGTGFVLRFEVLGQAAVLSDPIDVAVGPLARVAVVRDPGVATGGRPFRAQPQLRLQDAGGNTVTTGIGETTVHASLSFDAFANSSSSGEVATLLGAPSAQFRAGIAEFSDLGIDKAAVGYVIAFNVSGDAADRLGLNGTADGNITLQTLPFTVGIGPTHHLVLRHEPMGARGGLPFLQQPVVELQDAGGNVNTGDSDSTITVRIADDPTGRATLSPRFVYTAYDRANTTASAIHGNVYVNLTSDPNVLEPTLQHGDYIAIGPRSTMHPALGRQGARIRRVRPESELRLRLHEAWAGPTVTNAQLTKVTEGLTVRASRGVVTFKGLSIDKTSRDLTLLFTSSLHPEPLGTILARGRKGMGRVGYGYGYGLNATLDNVDPNQPIAVRSQPFDNTLGRATYLRVDVPAARAWAGGQPFLQQPVVSIVDGGGNVMIPDNETVVHAELNSNDTAAGNVSALLTGFRAIRAQQGQAEFLNLALARAGANFTLEFWAEVPGSGVLRTSQDVVVQPSAEWQLMPGDAQRGDQAGYAVGISGDIAAVAAPYDARRVEEVQIIRTRADDTEYVPEIQSVMTYADVLPEVQRISTGLANASTGAEIGGTFQLIWNTHISRALPYNTYAEYLKVSLEQDWAIGGIGQLDVTVVDVDANGTGSRSWLVTFRDLDGDVAPILADASGLTATGGDVAGMTTGVQRHSTQLGGRFQLELEGQNSSWIPYNAHPVVVEAAIEDFLRTGDVTVSRYTGQQGEAVRSYEWRVTFQPTEDNFNVPVMTLAENELTGNGASAFVHTIQQGRGPVGGGFELFVRDEGPTAPIPHDATADVVEARLEGLPSVEDVEVTRSGPYSDNGYAWTVVFKSTRRRTDEGFVLDQEEDHNTDLFPSQDAEVGAVADPYVWVPEGSSANPAMITGTNARVEVTYVYGNPESPEWHGAVAGASGRGAGSVYIFRRQYRTWVPGANETDKLQAHDTDAQDKFGWSVDVDDMADHTGIPATVLVGAPGAAFGGDLEVQELNCTGDSGTFTLSFLDRTTQAIPAAASLDDVRDALQSLATVHQVTVSAGSGLPEDPVCSGLLSGDPGTTWTVTFTFPQEGDLPSLVADATNLLDSTAPTGLGNVTVTETVTGQAVSSGANATMQAVGAAYIFEEQASGWQQTQKLTAPADRRELGYMFGAAVSLSGDMLAVGSPEDSDGGPSAGAVYLFQRQSASGEWTLYQRVAHTTTHTLGGAGHRFGSALALDGHSLVVGAPGKYGGQGEVLLYKRRPGASASYLIDQVFVPPPIQAAGMLGPLPLPSPAYAFGSSVDLADDLLIIGAPGARELPVTDSARRSAFDVQYAVARLTDKIGSLPSTAHRDAARAAAAAGYNPTTPPRGAAYLFDREDYWAFFPSSPRSVFVPSASQPGDGVGRAVAVSNGAALVSQLEDSWATRDMLTPRQEVQAVVMTAAEGAQVAGHFMLQWRTELVQAGRGPDGRGGGVSGDEQVWAFVETRRMDFNVSARDMRRVLEEDLGTGRLNVTRYGPNSQGAYRWFVTFVELSDSLTPDSIELLHPQTYLLTGENATVHVSRTSSPPPPLKGAVTAYTRPPGEAFGGLWTEQAEYAPYARQRADLFGFSLAADGNAAIVGMPNRDQHNSGVNSGAAMVLDLQPLSLALQNWDDPLANEVGEADGRVSLNVSICLPECQVPVGPGKADGEPPVLELLLATADGDDMGLHDDWRTAGPGGAVLADASLYPRGSKAARDHPARGPDSCLRSSEGSQDCEFLSVPGLLQNKTAFDLRGISDFAPVSGDLVRLDPTGAGANSSSLVAVVVTDDSLVEDPDEAFHVRLATPGIRPSFLGSLWATVTVTDDGDGTEGTSGYLQRVLPPPVESGDSDLADADADPLTQPWDGDGSISEGPAAHAAFGASLSLADGLVAIGAPYSPAADDAATRQCGAVHVYERVTGFWDAAAEIRRPGGDQAHAWFGRGVALSEAGSTGSRALVATASGPGSALTSVHFFEMSPDDPTAWDHAASLGFTVDPTLPMEATYQCGQAGAVAITLDRQGGRVAAVGCAGYEAVFVYRDPSGAGLGWAQTSLLQSSTARTVFLLHVTNRFQERFGAAVAFAKGVPGAQLVVGAPTANYGEYADPQTWNELHEMDDFTNFHGTGAIYTFRLVENVTLDDLSGAGDPSHAASWTAVANWTAADQVAAAGGSVHAIADSGGPANGSASSNDSVAFDVGNATAVAGLWVEHSIVTALDGHGGDRFGSALAMHRDQLIVGSDGNGARSEATFDFETGDLRGWTATGTAFKHQPTFGDNSAWRHVYSTALGPDLPQPAGVVGRYYIGTYEKRPGNPSAPTEEPTTMKGAAQGDAAQGTLTSDPFLIAGERISMLVGGGCDHLSTFVELLVDGEPTLRATGTCQERMRRVHWSVGRWLGRSAQIRISDLSSGSWGHVNVDDIRFDWDIQRYLATPAAGAAYVLRLRDPREDGEPCLDANQLSCTWEEQGKLEAADKRSHVRFGSSVAIDDDNGLAVVGAVSHSPVAEDFDLPGSISYAQTGTFGKMEGSFRADGGINSHATAYEQVNVWGEVVSPFLAAGGGMDSRGGVASLSLGDSDASGATNRLGGSGPSGSTGHRFDASGASPAVNARTAFNLGSPYEALQADATIGRGRQALAGDLRVPAARQGKAGFHGKLGRGLGGQEAEGVVYVFRRLPEKRSSRGPLVKPPTWPRKSELARVDLGWVQPGHMLGAAVAVEAGEALLGSPGDWSQAPAAGSVTAVNLGFHNVGLGELDYAYNGTHEVTFEYGDQLYKIAAVGSDVRHYAFPEGFHLRKMVVPVYRYGRLDDTLHVHYSTRDVTAFGVSGAKVSACRDLPIMQRSKAGCGDYEHVAGVLTFPPHKRRRDIVIQLVDDDCWEPEPEFFVLQLSVPGGAALQGYDYALTVRIDDDDVGSGAGSCMPVAPPRATVADDMALVVNATTGSLGELIATPRGDAYSIPGTT